MSAGLSEGVRTKILERVVPERTHRDRRDRREGDRAALAAREAGRDTACGLLELLDQHLEAGEELREVFSRWNHRVGVRGIRVKMTLLALTDRRILLAIEDHIDEVPAQVMVLQYGQIEVRPKRVQMGVEVLVEPTGIVAEVSKSQAADVAAALSAPPARASWLEGPPVYGEGVTPVASTAVPAGWHPDPAGRHEQRYWDGHTWTAHVADGGVQSSDPLA